MVGDHNRLISTYFYRIDQPQVDLAELLKRPAVKEAMAAVIAADPDSFQAARQHAERIFTVGR
ncbi:hypothetical protein [Kribbella sp. NPDC023855]|uniref:hypothetical protein n=1 Tax=Kribbella sp. NPDC023855 TaxID=3154698 RepID=UPI0033D050C8